MNYGDWGTPSSLKYFNTAVHMIIKACKLTCFCESHSFATWFGRLMKKKGHTVVDYKVLDLVFLEAEM